MFESLRTQTSSRTIQRLPVIKEPLEKQGDRRKNSCSQTSFNSQINFPKLKSKMNDSVIKQKDSVIVSRTTTFSESLKSVLNIDQLTTEKDFESCSNVFGPSECQLLFKVPSSEINDCEFETENEKLEESNALKRWEFWTKDRIRLQDHFSKHLEKSHCDLQFNELDKFRQMVEGRTLFEYSQIPYADKWRGHPYHWKPPLSLNKRKSPDCDFENSPRYCAVKSKLEKGEVPEMEFIGIPLAIKKEKGLICKSKKSLKKNWEETSYQEERITHFLKLKKRLKPSDIQMDELAVVGIKIPQKKEETNGSGFTENIPEIFITSDDEGPKDFRDYRQSIFCLVIQGEEMKYEIGTDDCQVAEKAFTWQVDFGVNAVGCLVVKVLRVENRGTVAVRYDWLCKNAEQNLFSDSLKMKQREPWFFFDKNSVSTITGLTKDISQSKTKCERKMSSPSVTVENAVLRWPKRKEKKVDDLFGLQVTETLILGPTSIRRLSVSFSGFFLPGQIYDLKFYCHAKCLGIRKEVWHLKTKPPLSQTQEMGAIVLSVMATKEILNEGEALISYLKKRVRDSAVSSVIQILLYNVFSSTKGLRDLEYRSLFCEKELFENHNLKYYYHSEVVRALKELFQEISSNKQTDWDFSLDSLVELVKTYKEGEEKSTLFFQIAKKAKKLLRPSFVSVKNVKTYRMAFQILCCMTNFAEEDYNYIRNLVSQKIEEGSGEKTCLGVEMKELWSSCSLKSEKISDSDSSKVANDIIQMMFYLKMYKRVCEAIEQITGVFETNRLFQPHKQYDYNKLKKPSRTNNSPV